jgi:glycosyltransferase involved in cell wall biosynthesis
MLEPVKDLGTFLQAAALVAERRPGTRFHIFGAGSQEAELRRRAALLGAEVEVVFPGHVDSGTALSQLSVFVLSSLMENEPMGVLEAMVAGAAVVASRVGGVPGLAPSGTALLVAPGDVEGFAAAIERLLADPEQRERQVAAARLHVERHRSAQTMARRTVALYRELLERRAR